METGKDCKRWCIVGFMQDFNMAAKRDRVRKSKQKRFFDINILRRLTVKLCFDEFSQQTSLNWKPVQRKPL